MNKLMATFWLSCFSVLAIQAQQTVRLEKVKWIYGAQDCTTDTSPAIQVVRYNHNTYILRQNKCVHYEAPFLFLLIGKKKALLMDTGATEDENKFPLYKTIRGLLDEWEQANHQKLELVVAHTHAHGDHIAADKQFAGQPATTVVGLSVKDVTDYFQVKEWPTQTAAFDAGDRTLDIIPIPGHQEASIAVYDRATKILLTGDSFYPGRLYIRDWPAFALSTQRLIDFCSTHPISYILGNHIEMSRKPGKDYSTGCTCQPNEYPLPLHVKELKELNGALKAAAGKPVHEVHNSFIIYPK